MGIPTPELTWDYTNINVDLNSTGNGVNDHKQMDKKWKDMLVALGFSVKLSCSSLDWAVRSYDTWTSISYLPLQPYFGDYDRPWIVLKNCASMGGLELCLLRQEWSGSNENNCRFFMSRDGFSGGSRNSDPAGNQWTFLDYGAHWYWTASATTFNTAWHGFIGRDPISGDIWSQRLFILEGGVVRHYYGFEKLKNPVSGITDPTYLFMLGLGTAAGPTHGNLNRGTSQPYRACINGSLQTVYLSCEGYVDYSLGEKLAVPHDITGEWPLLKAGVVCEGQGRRGYLGELYDLWFTSSGLAAGDMFPGDGSKQLITFPNIVVPWDGVSTPLLG